MRTSLFVGVLFLAACGAADGHREPVEVPRVQQPPPGLEGRALHEMACDHAVGILQGTPEALEGYSLAELRLECLEELAETRPQEARAMAHCYLAAEDFPGLVLCADPEQIEAYSQPMDPLIWNVCVHMAEVALKELSGQVDVTQIEGLKEMAVAACVDSLEDVPQHELEVVSDCILKAKSIDEMQGCNVKPADPK